MRPISSSMDKSTIGLGAGKAEGYLSEWKFSLWILLVDSCGLCRDPGCAGVAVASSAGETVDMPSNLASGLTGRFALFGRAALLAGGPSARKVAAGADCRLFDDGCSGSGFSEPFDASADTSFLAMSCRTDGFLCTSARVRESIRSESSACLLYTSPSPRDRTRSRMPSSA